MLIICFYRVMIDSALIFTPKFMLIVSIKIGVNIRALIHHDSILEKYRGWGRRGLRSDTSNLGFPTLQYY